MTQPGTQKNSLVKPTIRYSSPTGGQPVATVISTIRLEDDQHPEKCMGPPADQFGRMLWLNRKRLVGSYRCFNATRRSRFAPKVLRTILSLSSYSPGKFIYSAPVANRCSARNTVRPHSRAVSSSSAFSQLDSMPSRNGADRSPKAVSEAPVG